MGLSDKFNKIKTENQKKVKTVASPLELHFNKIDPRYYLSITPKKYPSEYVFLRIWREELQW